MSHKNKIKLGKLLFLGDGPNPVAFFKGKGRRVYRMQLYTTVSRFTFAGFIKLCEIFGA